MKRFALLLCFLNLALSAHAADVPADAGLAEVRDLGHLNGQALACNLPKTASLIKSVIIQHAPKSRRYGAIFEEATNEAFLAQSHDEQAVCPDAATINDKVGEATKRLRAAVPAAMAR